MRSPILYAVLLALISAHLTGCIGPGANTTMTPQSADSFPVVSGINLNGRTIEIPRELEGGRRVVIVAFEQRQQAEVDTWIKGLEEDLRANSDLKLYELPVIYEGSAAFRFWVNNGMRSGITDETARNRTITVYTDREKFYAALGVRQDTITTFLIDTAGKIVWRADGASTPEALASLRSAIAR